jgi:transcriptional regulator with XRE-family HTH domain
MRNKMNAISRLRKKQGLSQVQLAEKLNITQGAVSQWEMGLSNPKSEILPELAKALDCTIDELFEDDMDEIS